jgi:hypothetical protein
MICAVLEGWQPVGLAPPLLGKRRSQRSRFGSLLICKQPSRSWGAICTLTYNAPISRLRLVARILTYAPAEWAKGHASH